MLAGPLDLYHDDRGDYLEEMGSFRVYLHVDKVTTRYVTRLFYIFFLFFITTVDTFKRLS